MSVFKDKTVMLGICGGIAAYKACELVRLLVEAGAEVHCLLTPEAKHFVTPLSLQALSGHPCHTDLFSLTEEQEISHIALADEADAMVIAPTTANMLARLAHGLADDLISTVVLATKAPILLTPSMNVNMWEHPATQANLKRCQDLGYQVLDPEAGYLACGWKGKGRLPDPAKILRALENLLQQKKPRIVSQ